MDEEFFILGNPYRTMIALVNYVPESILRNGMTQWIKYIKGLDDGKYEDTDPLEVLAQYIILGYAYLPKDDEDEPPAFDQAYVDEVLKKLWEGETGGKQEDS